MARLFRSWLQHPGSSGLPSACCWQNELHGIAPAFRLHGARVAAGKRFLSAEQLETMLARKFKRKLSSEHVMTYDEATQQGHFGACGSFGTRGHFCLASFSRAFRAQALAACDIVKPECGAKRRCVKKHEELQCWRCVFGPIMWEHASSRLKSLLTTHSCSPAWLNSAQQAVCRWPFPPLLRGPRQTRQSPGLRTDQSIALILSLILYG